MMGFYAEWIVPPLIDLSMRNKRLRPYRERVAAAAEGRILDVGIGSGMNLPFHAPQAREVFGLEPSPVRLLEGAAEHIPLADRVIDTVVLTRTGCSMPDVACALPEMRRVLKPSGRLLFVEHGRAAEPGLARWQDRLTPFWQRISGDCASTARSTTASSTRAFASTASTPDTCVVRGS
jgi:SAM-dependent methyltransferase